MDTLVAHALRADGFDASEDGTGRGTPLVPIVSPTLFGSDGGASSGYQPVIPLVFGGNNTSGPIEVAPALSAHAGPHGRLDFESGTFIINAAESCAKQGHARRSDVARCLDGTGSFASAQGGTVVAQPFNIVGLGQEGRNHSYPADVSGCLQHKGLSASGNEAGTVIVEPIPIDMRQASRGETMTNNRREGSSGGAPGVGIGEPGDPAPSISLSHPPAIAFQERGRADGRNIEWQEGVSYALRAIDGGGCGDWFRIAYRWAVRRLTPLECERLQGFPDDWTLIPYRGKDAADGPRYKAIGNSMAVNCMRWIGRRIAMLESAS